MINYIIDNAFLMLQVCGDICNGHVLFTDYDFSGGSSRSSGLDHIIGHDWTRVSKPAEEVMFWSICSPSIQ